MAFPVDAARATTSISTAADPWTVTLPTSAAGLYIVYGRAAGAQTFNLPSGWSWLIQNNVDDATDDVTAVIYRDSTAGEGSTLSWDLSGSAKGATLAWRVTGHEAAAMQAPEAQVATFTTAANAADPPSIDPAGDSKDFLFLAICGFDGETQTISAAPANYTNLQTQNSGTGGAAATNCRVGGASRQLTTTTENPGAFTHTAAGQGGLAITVAVHPPGPQTVTGGVASEANAAPAGQAAQIYAASVATQTDTTLSGQVAQVYTASPAAESDTALGGSVQQPQVISGGVAGETDTAAAGQVQQIYVSAAPGAETDSVPAGQAAQTYTATAAGETDTAPVGSVRQIYTAAPGAEADTVPAGTAAQVYTAAPAAESDSAPAGSVSQSGGGTTVSGGVATSNESAVAGTVAQVYTASPAVEADAVRVATVLQAILVLGGVAGEADAAPAATTSALAEWSYGADGTWTYGPYVAWHYTGGTVTTYGGGGTFTYGG